MEVVAVVGIMVVAAAGNLKMAVSEVVVGEDVVVGMGSAGMATAGSNDHVGRTARNSLRRI